MSDTIEMIRQERSRGTRAIGTTCTFVPRPILSVDGLFPVRLGAPDVAGTPLADTYLSSLTCQYVRSLLELAMDGQLDELDGWVFAATCDHLRRLYDNLVYLAPPPFAHILDVPHRAGPEAISWFTEELRILCGKLEDHFSVELSDALLDRAIRRENDILGRLAAIGALRKSDPPTITGTAFQRLMMAWQTMPPAAFGPVLDSLAESLVDGAEAQAPPDRWGGDLRGKGQSGLNTRPPRARLMVVGSQIDHPRWIQVVESLGAAVVADRFCTGSIPGLEPWPTDGDPLRTMAEHLLTTSACPRMMEAFDRRLDLLLAAVRDYRVDGVVVEALKFCDLWGFEASALTRELRERNIPVLRIEREYSGGGEGQLRTRVQAFLESMGR